MGSIYLIRHGQASFGAQNYDVLSPLGARQAQVLGSHLARLGVRFDRCISGSLKRQQHTASTTLEQMRLAGQTSPTIEIEPAFNELDIDGLIQAYLPGILSGETEAPYALQSAALQPAKFQRLFSMMVECWLSDNQARGAIESWNDFRGRVYKGLQELLPAAGTPAQIAIFTSGGPIIALLHMITGISASRAFELAWQIANTSVSQLRFEGDRVTLTSFNSHVHLELLRAPELITYI